MQSPNTLKSKSEEQIVIAVIRTSTKRKHSKLTVLNLSFATYPLFLCYFFHLSEMLLNVKIRTRTTTTGVPFSKPLHIAANVVKSPPSNNMTTGTSLSNSRKYINS